MVTCTVGVLLHDRDPRCPYAILVTDCPRWAERVRRCRGQPGIPDPALLALGTIGVPLEEVLERRNDEIATVRPRSDRAYG